MAAAIPVDRGCDQKGNHCDGNQNADQPDHSAASVAQDRNLHREGFGVCCPRPVRVRRQGRAVTLAGSQVARPAERATMAVAKGDLATGSLPHWGLKRLELSPGRFQQPGGVVAIVRVAGHHVEQHEPFDCAQGRPLGFAQSVAGAAGRSGPLGGPRASLCSAVRRAGVELLPPIAAASEAPLVMRWQICSTWSGGSGKISASSKSPARKT